MHKPKATQAVTPDMRESRVENLHVQAQEVLSAPSALKSELPLTESARQTILEARETIQNILKRDDPRLIVVVGPCSIHDVKAAEEYAGRLKKLAEEVQDTLYLVMRVYFEKPRTTTGWKGLINDPHLDDSFKIEEGLRIGRRLLLDLNDMGLPCATEALDPILPQYLHDLVSWTAIGARTTESQTHREMASGLSTAIGFKNGTDGNLTVAINALLSVSKPHRFLGINQKGQVVVVRTDGNPYAHIVLRGGDGGANYDARSVAACERALTESGLQSNIMVDCSHANSNKDPAIQPVIIDDVVEQIVRGNRSIVGLMIESHLHQGNQKLTAGPKDLKYGVSITDACIDWNTTEVSLRDMHDRLRDVLPKRKS